jgi:cell division protein FtsL
VTATPAATRRRARLTPGAVLLAVIIAVLLFVMSVPLRTYLAQRAQLDRLQLQSQVLQQQNSQLRERVAQLHDPAYLQRLARECLGMVKPGEIRFSVTGGNQPGGSGSGAGVTDPPDC